MALLFYFAFIYVFVPSFRSFVNSIFTTGPNRRIRTLMGQNTKIFLWIGFLLVLFFMIFTTVFAKEIKEMDEKLAYRKYAYSLELKRLENKCVKDEAFDSECSEYLSWKSNQ